MVPSIVFFAIVFSIYGAVEFYGYQALKTAINPTSLSTLKWAYWVLAPRF